MHQLDSDILIIGSGAAGGVLAGTLSELTDKKIILIEKGGFFNRHFFNQHEWDMRVLYADDGARAIDNGSMPVRGGECVGGGTTVNVALSFDPVTTVWERWRHDYGLAGFSYDNAADDYGLRDLNMRSCLREIRQRINVMMPLDEQVNDNNRLFAEGCASRGITTKRFQLNMRDCIGCGFCAAGCAYDRKQGTMITYIADALARGVELIHHCSIEHIDYKKQGSRLRATGVRGRIRRTAAGSLPNSYSPGSLEIHAKLILVCAGSIESPLLLLRSEHPDPHQIIGRGLVLHPSLSIVGIMDHELTNYRGITGTYYSDHFLESDNFYYECLFGHPIYAASVLPFIGPEHFELMLNFSRLAGFGVMLVDSTDMDNRVEWDRIRGQKRIIYCLTEDDKRRLRTAAKVGVEIMFAAGANEVLLPSEEPVGPLSAPRFRAMDEAKYCDELRFVPIQTTITSSHCQASVKMGEERERSIINSRGEAHDVDNLIVCDSSSFPTSLARIR